LSSIDILNFNIDISTISNIVPHFYNYSYILFRRDVYINMTKRGEKLHIFIKIKITMYILAGRS